MRKILIRFMLICAALIAGCLIYGFFIEPKQLVIRSVEVATPNWHQDPIRIALLSDIHIGGPHVQAERMDEIVKAINAQNVDFILMAGDFIHGHNPVTKRSAKFNAEVKAGIIRLGDVKPTATMYGVIGNHDVWYSESVVTELLSPHMTVLKNSVDVNSNICFVGLADFDTQHADPNAFNQCPVGADIIAIMHSPDSFRYLRRDTALAVAGHTHGGQINIPLIGRAVTATQAGRQYAYGRVNVKGVPAFVTAGIGTSMLDARFRAPPEIVVIELRAGG